MAYRFNSGSLADKIQNAQLITLAGSDKEVLNVEGKIIQLAPDGLKPGYTFSTNSDGTSLIGGTFASGDDFAPNSQSGIFQDDDTTYVFTQGKLTPVSEIPKSGKVDYYGLASYHVNNETLNSLVKDSTYPPKWEIHGVKLVVDFSEQTVKGDILTTLDYVSTVSAEIDAKISGNTFSGERNGTKTNGAFFGENAQEIGGVYINEEKGFAGGFIGQSADAWSVP